MQNEKSLYLYKPAEIGKKTGFWGEILLFGVKN